MRIAAFPWSRRAIRSGAARRSFRFECWTGAGGVGTAGGRGDGFCGWREPDMLRVGPAPLYDTAEDIDRFVDAFVASL
jgi:hypothetical protein